MTRLFVLGCLDFQPMSGYDIQQMLQMNDSERWGGVLIGSIYHALNKLEKEKLIEIDRIEQTGHRQRAVYRITKKGQKHFKELLIETMEKSSVNYPSSLYAALSFNHKLPKEEIIKSLEKQYEFLEKEDRSLKSGLEEKQHAMGEVPALTKLIFNNMSDTVHVQQKFIKQLIATIQ